MTGTKRGPDPDVARNQAILGFAKSGQYTMAQLAELYGVSRQRIHQILQREGMEHTPRAESMHARVQAAVEAVVQGRGEVTIAQAAEEHNASPSAIRRWLERRDDFDLGAERAARREERRLARVAGDGEVECRRCKVVKPWSDMRQGKNDRGLHDRQNLCRECNSEVSRYHFAKRTQENRGLEPTVTEATCSRCGETKPADDFNRQTSANNLLQSWCKACHRDFVRDRRQGAKTYGR